MATIETEVKEDRFITIQEGCQRIGISIRTAHRMRGSNEFPELFLIGGRLKFRASDIDAYIRNGGRVDA